MKHQPWLDENAKPFIEFANVTKRFGSFTAVDDLSLRIFEREFFALLGPSGCGKTTLMRMVAGFEEPTEGEVRLAGENLVGIPPHRRPVNMMFQSYALFPHMNVAKNIGFGLKQDGMGKGEIDDRVAEMLELVKMSEFAARKPDQLSGGQRQRVALARSLAKQPKVLLLDEPLGALDRKLREATQFELVDLQERLGITFMIVTHDQEEAMTVADRIAVMNQGRLVQVAPPAEIYEQPGSRYVADFVGDINILEAEAAKCGSGKVTLAAKAGFEIRANSALEPNNGQPVWFAIRPEKTRLNREKPKQSPLNAVKGEVWDIAYLGDMTVYNVRLGDGTIVKSSMLNSAHSTEIPFTWEDEVWLSWGEDSGIVLTE